MLWSLSLVLCGCWDRRRVIHKFRKCMPRSFTSTCHLSDEREPLQADSKNMGTSLRSTQDSNVPRDTSCVSSSCPPYHATLARATQHISATALGTEDPVATSCRNIWAVGREADLVNDRGHVRHFYQSEDYRLLAEEGQYYGPRWGRHGERNLKSYKGIRMFAPCILIADGSSCSFS